MIPVLARALLALLSVLWCALPVPASAFDLSLEERARALFEQGLQESREGNFEVAVASFERASELVERTSVLQNLAVALAELGRHDEGLTVVERALRLEPAGTASHDALTQLKKRLEVARSAQAPAPAASNEAPPATLGVAPISAVDSAAPKPETVRSASDRRLPWALASAGAGVALASGATALYLLSGRESQQYAQRCRDGSCSDAEFEGARTGVRRLERSAYGLWALSGAAAAAACTLLVFERKARRGFDALVVSPRDIQVRVRF